MFFSLIYSAYEWTDRQQKRPLWHTMLFQTTALHNLPRLSVYRLKLVETYPPYSRIRLGEIAHELQCRKPFIKMI